MGTDSGATARIDRLRALYSEQFRETFDKGEFLGDDFYAFQVLERAFQIGTRNRELHNLAILMHAERKALMETGQRQALEALRNSSQPPSQPGPASITTPATSAPNTLSPQPGPRPIGAWKGPKTERRSGKVRLTAQEITLLSGLRRAYHKHFGESFDVEEFACNDLYAKVVLAEAMSSGQEDVMALAKAFLDKNGKPRLHRRQGQVDVELAPRERRERA
jgi:hypothetical protein